MAIYSLFMQNMCYETLILIGCIYCWMYLVKTVTV